MNQTLPVRQHGSFFGHIGLARTDITPPVGIYNRNWGAAHHDTAETIHRPLTLTALTLSAAADAEPLVLIDADLGWWRPLNLFESFRGRLLEELELEPSRFVFALSHTHASAPLMEPDPSLEGSELLGPWLETVFAATVTTVRQALAESFEATMDWHAGKCQLAAVRDLPDPAADRDRFLCGYNPAAAADETLLLGRVTDRTGKLRATLVNYACHPTTLAWENTSISPDYIGAMRETMEAATGATALFLQGASGDLAPRYQYVGDPTVADRHGRQLGFAALATLNDMEPSGMQLCFGGVMESGAPLAVWQHQPRDLTSTLKAVERSVELELKDWPTADELEQQRIDCQDRAMEERLRRKRDIRRALGDGCVFPLSIYAWRIGEVVLVGCGAEAYSLLQQQLRERFPERTILCMNLINGSIGYLPPAELYSEDVYPVWQTPFAAGSLERLTAAMTDTIEELLNV